MVIVEKAYQIKKEIKKTYRKYFSIDEQYTCILPDKIYLQKKYRKKFNKELDFKNPKTYTEKLNWLKIYDKRAVYSIMVDKYRSRDYIVEKFGEEYLVPLLGVWDSPDEIDFDSLPNGFVLKCNHESGMIVCKDKSELDIDATKDWFRSRLKRNYYKKHREYAYKSVPRKIICEKFMENTDGSPLLDYKIFCFNGDPRYVMVNSSRFDDIKTDMYTPSWEWIPMQDGPHILTVGDVFEMPSQLDKILEMSKEISKDIPFIRVDFNVWNDKLYMGEMTLYHCGGFEKFYTPEGYEEQNWDEVLGAELNLPKKHRRKI